MDENNQKKEEEEKETEETEEEKENCETPKKPVIKHLVIAGGGTYGFQAYGALQETHKHGVWNIDNIQSCYTTSIGSVLGIMLLMRYNEDELDNYIIKRPWHQLFKYDMNSIFNSFRNTGFFGIHTFKQMLLPLLKGMDYSEDITLQEFYEKTKVELHIYSTNVNTFETVDLSYKTHPHWTLIESAYSSCCVPIFFKPFEKDAEFYIDGGVLLNYPLEKCLYANSPDEILGICKKHKKGVGLQAEMNLLEFVGILLTNTISKIDPLPTAIIPYEIVIESPLANINDMFEFSQSETYRKEWVEKGRALVKSFIESWG